MGARIRVFVYSDDAISQAGMQTQLRGQTDVNVVDETQIDDAQVAVVIVDSVDDAACRTIRAIQRNGCPRVVLVVGVLDDNSLMVAVEVGACGVLRRKEATSERVCAAVTAAAGGDGTLAPDLLGRLMTQFGRLQREVLAPRGIGPAGLSDREVEVLKMLADGQDTAAIARTLAYSERTIKNIIHDVTARLNLRNRSHAVAYAVKSGLI
jgi:DNA-binding NarL/FixJ family response regulator